MYKLRSKHIFWILQLLGWGGLSVFSVVITGMAKNLTAGSIIFSASLFIGIFTTSILRWYYKKFIDLDALTIWSFAKIALGMIVMVLLLPHITYYFGYAVGYVTRYFIEDRKEYFNAPPLSMRSSKYLGHFIIIFGWTVLYFSIKGLRKLNSQRIARLQLRDNVKQAQLNTLKGHINPQFMFTTLNNIKGLMLEDVPQSREMLTKLSEMLRYSLTKNNVNAISLEDELEMVMHYIDLSKIQYGDRLSFSSEINGDSRSITIPPMLILNLIENATKNGVFQLQHGGGVQLSIMPSDGFLTLSVTHSQNQLKNKSYDFEIQKIKQRLRLLFKENAIFRMETEEDHTVIRIVLPIVKRTNEEIYPKIA